MVNFEVTSSNSFRDISKNHFVTAVAEEDIDDSIKRKRFRVSLKNAHKLVGHAKRRGSGIFGRFPNFDICRSEVDDDVISGVVVDCLRGCPCNIW